MNSTAFAICWFKLIGILQFILKIYLWLSIIVYYFIDDLFTCGIIIPMIFGSSWYVTQTVAPTAVVQIILFIFLLMKNMTYINLLDFRDLLVLKKALLRWKIFTLQKGSYTDINTVFVEQKGTGYTLPWMRDFKDHKIWKVCPCLPIVEASFDFNLSYMIFDKESFGLF